MIRFALSRPALAALALVAATLVASAAVQAAPPPPASDDDEAPASVSRPVVEPTAPSAGKALNAALGRLAKEPRNIEALLDAGNAALALGDDEAAVGFFNRADQVAPGNPRVKLAMAGARLRLDDPVEALRWFADAEHAGADPAAFALDRGLAYALVGDSAAAVAEYRKAREHAAPDAAQDSVRDEAARREAISLAIGGDRRSADLVLLPLLQRQDRAAWRAHIFVLAIAGRGDEAVAVTQATMPADLAAAIGPYLRFMVQLTPAQQAAVASLGHFPRAADIGRDDVRIVSYAAAHPRVPLVPAAAPAAKLAQASPTRDSDARARRRKPREAAPAPAAPLMVATREADIALPPPPPPPVMVAAAPPVVPPVSRTTTTPRAGFDLAQATGTRTEAGAAVAAVVPRPTVLSRLDMPPPPRRTSAVPAPASPAATPAFQSAPVVQPTLAPAPAAAQAAAPDSHSPDSHPVVQPVPDQPAPALASADLAKAVLPVAVPPKPSAPAHDKASPSTRAPDKPARDTAAQARTGKTAAADSADATPRSAKDKAAKAKLARGKPAADAAADADPAPCKPVAKAKGRKGRAQTARDDHGKSRHRGKGHADSADTETCAASARGARPDGPAGVSRSTDSEDDSRAAKGKGAKAKGKGRDQAADSEKPAKGGKRARYASRIWVEVLTGADRDKMPGEWRNLVRKAHKLKGRKPYLTPWRNTFRLLTGPFDSDADAQDFIAELRKDGVSGFEWTSPAGQAVDSLPLP